MVALRNVTDNTPRFDVHMYRAALAFYGLPSDYTHVFRLHPIIDKETGEAKEETQLRSCFASQTSREGKAVWVQINPSSAFTRPFIGKDGKEHKYPRKTKTEEVKRLQNITLDFEYPAEPHKAHIVAQKLLQYLVQQGLAHADQPAEDSGAGSHFVLPLPAIDIAEGDGERWNNAVALLVTEKIKPEFQRLCAEAQIEMDIEGYDISRILSAPGTWRPHNPQKNDCPALQKGVMRKWLAPYINGRYPVRQENQALKDLLQTYYERCTATPKREHQARPSERPDAYEWLCRNAGNYYQEDRSKHFQAVVTALYLRCGEQAVEDLANDIDRLTGGKYGERAFKEAQRSLQAAKNDGIKRNDQTPAHHSSEVQAAKEPAPNAQASSNKASILVGKQLDFMGKATLKALTESQKKAPSIFVQAKKLIRISTDQQTKRPIVHPLGLSEMRSAIADIADFYRLKKKEEEEGSLVDVCPPKEVVEYVIYPDDPGEKWKSFQPLSGIVETPILRPDGSIVVTPGYDESTRMYYAPTEDLVRLALPEHPTQEDAKQARSMLETIFEEFPFDTSADRANALGMMLTPFISPSLINNDIPLQAVSASGPGTGKGLLVDVISIIATGTTVAPLKPPTTEEEWDKTILSKLLTACPIVKIDNVPGELDSVALQVLLTGKKKYEGRPLGQSKIVQVDNPATWFATGNNIAVVGDLAERVVWVRMTSQTSDPEEREFKIDNLEEYVKKHRREIITAILTMIKAWYKAGAPLDKSLPNFRTFTQWSDRVGSILSFAGVTGFLSDRIERKNTQDGERVQWEKFLSAWYTLFRSSEKKGGEIKATCLAGSDAGSDERSEFFFCMPIELQEEFNTNAKGFAQKLGKALQARIGRRYGKENFYVERGKPDRTNVSTWIVFEGSAGSAGSGKLPTQGEIQRKDPSIDGSENQSEREANNSLQLPAKDIKSTTPGVLDQPVEPNDGKGCFAGSQETTPCKKPLPANVPTLSEKERDLVRSLPTFGEEDF